MKKKKTLWQFNAVMVPVSDSVALDVHDKPRHIAFVMDGNGRWATRQGKSRLQGHQQGLRAAKRVVNYALKYDIPIITLFAFSNENWSRPATEINWLMRLLQRAIVRETKYLSRQQVRVRFIGRRDRLPADLVKALTNIEQETQAHQHCEVLIALDYGGRWDMLQATQQLTRKCLSGELNVDELVESDIACVLSTAGLPDPDLFIRTSGESRLSNFLLWQCAYTECYFTERCWPDFDENDFQQCLTYYAGRQRRFGRTTAQQEINHA